jgi:UDP-glucose 4-epimerase
MKTAYYLAGFRKNIAVHTQEPFQSLSGNVLPLLNFLEAAKDSDLQTLVYVSSTIVEYALADSDVVDGYVWGKYINELIVKSFAAETKKVVKIVRSAAVYGPGNSFEPAVANFIPALINRVAGSIGELVVWGKGERELQFIYIDDLVENLIAAASSKENFFAVGNSEKLTVNDVANLIIKLMDKKLEIRHDTSKPDKPTQISSFNNLIRPKVDLAQGLSETVADYRQTHV